MANMITVIEPYPDWNKMRLWRLILAASIDSMQQFRIVVSSEQYVDFVPEFNGRIRYEKYIAASLPISWWDRIEVVDHLDDAKISNLMEELPAGSSVYIWNGQKGGLPEIYSRYAKKLRFCFFELGWMPQSQNIWCDPMGVNGASSLSYIQEQRVGEKILINSPKTALILLQLESDTNITRFSPFRTMREFVDHVSRILPDSIEKILVRPHPRETRKITLTDHRAHFSQVALVEDIERSDVVLAINSTAIIECLLRGKPVISFGRGVFSNKKVCAEAAVKDDWKVILSKKVVPPEVFIRQLKEREQRISDLLCEQGQAKICSTADVGRLSNDVSTKFFGRPISRVSKMIGLLLKPYFYRRFRKPLTIVY